MALTAVATWATIFPCMYLFHFRFIPWLEERRAQKKATETDTVKCVVNPSCLTKVQVGNIESVNQLVRSIDGNTLVDVAMASLSPDTQTVMVPTHVLKLIRTLSGSMIAQTVLEIQTARANDYVAADKARALALASCLYDFYVPYNAILIDGLTKAYMHQIMRMQVPGMYFVEPHRRIYRGSALEMTIPPDEILRKYTAMTPHVGAVLTILANYPILPPRPAMYIEVKTRAGQILRNLNNKKIPTEAEIFMMMTAFASIAKIKIPESYYEESRETTFLVTALTEPKHTPPQLTVVKKA